LCRTSSHFNKKFLAFGKFPRPEIEVPVVRASTGFHQQFRARVAAGNEFSLLSKS
jgi:hypothetical protein